MKFFQQLKRAYYRYPEVPAFVFIGLIFVIAIVLKYLNVY